MQPTIFINCQPLTSGRWYWEIKQRDVRASYFHGVACVEGFAPKEEAGSGVGSDKASWGINTSGSGALAVRHAGKDRPFGERAYDGSTLCIAIDIDAGAMFACKDGNWDAGAWGVAFEGCDFKSGGGVRPASTASNGGCCEFTTPL